MLAWTRKAHLWILLLAFSRVCCPSPCATNSLSCLTVSSDFEAHLQLTATWWIQRRPSLLERGKALSIQSQDEHLLTNRGEREWLFGVRGREWEWIVPILKFGIRKGMKKSIPKIRERKGNKKNIPKIREREGKEKIHSHFSRTRIRGYHSQE